MSETERAVGHPTALFRACDLSVRINHDLDLLPRRQPARRGQPVEHLKPFGLVIAIRHPPRQARDRVAAADGNDIDAPRPDRRHLGRAQPPHAAEHRLERTEERRVGKEWFHTCRSRWPPQHLKKNKSNTTYDK